MKTVNNNNNNETASSKMTNTVSRGALNYTHSFY